jgi:hypothetical protein
MSTVHPQKVLHMNKDTQSPERIKRDEERAKCSHAWVTNVRPAVCLFCGSRKPQRKSK